MLTILGNRESFPRLYSFKLTHSENLDWSLCAADGILKLANADTIVLTPEVLTFLLNQNIPIFDSKKDAKVYAKQLPESQWRYWEVYIQCMPANYKNSWNKSVPLSKRWKSK